MQTSPNWSKHYTAKDFTKEFGEFKGPGFYLGKYDTVLVTANTPRLGIVSNWKKKQPKDTIYRVDVYNTPFENTLFAIIALAPVREDKR